MVGKVSQYQFGEIDREHSPKPRRTTKRANSLDGATWIRHSISIWDDIRKTSEEIALKHPAIFPAQLPMRLLQCFTTNKDRMILDPFVGIGSTVLAAEALGKIGIGLDVSEEYIQKAGRRSALTKDMFDGTNGDEIGLGERRYYLADANDLLDYVEPNSVDMVITSPPYWDILLRNRTADYKKVRHYGDSDKDIGKIADYDTFLTTLTGIFENVYKALRPGKYCCVVVMDLRKKSNFYPYHADLANRMEEIDFILDDIIIWNRAHEYNNLRPLGYPSVFRVNRIHEYILIFKKPDKPKS